MNQKRIADKVTIISFVLVVALVSQSASASTTSTIYIGGSRPTFTTPYTVNSSTGAATLFGSTVGLIEGMSYDSTRDRIVATLRSDNTIKTIDPVSGTVGSLSLAAPDTLQGLAYDSNRDIFWASDQDTGMLYKVNPVTGQALPAQPMPLSGSVRPGGLGFDPVNDLLYAVVNNRLFKINPTAAPYVPVSIGPVGFGLNFTDVDAMEFDVATGLLYIVNDEGTGPQGTGPLMQRFASLNPATGIATLIGPTGLQPQFGQGMAIVPLPVPEPTSMLLFAIGSAALLFRRRRS